MKMKIGIVPFYDGLLNNKLFDIKDHKLNADNLLTPYFEIKEKLESLYIVNTIDLCDNLHEIDCVFFFRLDYKLLSQCIKNKVSKLIYFAWEPEVVEERHSKKGMKRLEPFFDAIMTWNDDLVDNVKYYKINYPYFFCGFNNKCSYKDFEEKKLLVNISGNKYSSHKSELYSERIKVITYYEKSYRDDFELYGRGWSNKNKCFKGECLSKKDIYENFKFALCLENMHDVNGYITEKIFDCFSAGIVPVYWGADNVEDYIPKGCYVDYRKFDNIKSLDNYLSSISYQEYASFISNINAFVSSNQKDIFTSSFFCDVAKEVIQKKPQRYYRCHTWQLYLYKIYYVVKGKFKKMVVA